MSTAREFLIAGSCDAAGLLLFGLYVALKRKGDR